ncbi:MULTISPECIES: helix-turn-helix domain-containing protein [Butyricimonas]|uniref:helix-turn-helix domain-containing protein n=1 Tax=Butyricimonas TaxID=574697 RepID=UPI0011DDFE5A|nr:MULTISPECIES: helix-turn-helix transcriptional regulator [Butyricimonas]
MNVNERIKCIVDECFDGNVSAFARAIDISQSTLKDIVGGRFSKPGYDVLEKILSAESLFISPDWLMKGKGDMIIQNVNQTNEHGDNINTASGNISVNKTNDENIKALKDRIDELIQERDEYKDKVIALQEKIIEIMSEKN